MTVHATSIGPLQAVFTQWCWNFFYWGEGGGASVSFRVPRLLVPRSQNVVFLPVIPRVSIFGKCPSPQRRNFTSAVCNHNYVCLPNKCLRTRHPHSPVFSRVFCVYMRTRIYWEGRVVYIHTHLHSRGTVASLVPTSCSTDILQHQSGWHPLR